MSSLHSWIELNAHALRQNYKILCQLAGRSCCVPIIKGNAYGHGLEEIYQILSQEKPNWLGVNYIYEANQLRNLGYGGRILIVGPLLAQDLGAGLEVAADLIIGQMATLEAWLAMPNKPKIHIKVDTGLSRQGFNLQELAKVCEKLQSFRENVVGICTHFANVEDVTNTDYANFQLMNFSKACSIASSYNLNLLKHAASSASTLIFESSHLDLCRVGIALYGFWPSGLTRLSFASAYKSLVSLTPVLSWRTRVAAVREIPAHTYVGYGCSFKSSHPMKIAILATGYYEGYPRIAAHKGSYVLVDGIRCPIIGRICMNMMFVDASAIDGVQVGDVATLIGQDKDENIAAEQIADWAETIHYDVVTGINSLLPRIVSSANPRSS